MTLIDPGGDRDPKASLALRPAVTLAGGTWGLDDLAITMTTRTGADIDHLAEHRLSDAADFASTLALRAGDGLRAFLRPAAGTGLAALQDPEFDFLVRALDGLLKGQAQVVAQIRPGLGSATPGRPAGGRRAAEEGIEDVAEATEPLEPGASPAARPVYAGPTKGVVALPSLRVGQDLVGVVDLLEPLLGLRLRVDIGVPLLGELAEGALDISVARAALDAEHLVEVAFRGGHPEGSLREAARWCGQARRRRCGQARATVAG